MAEPPERIRLLEHGRLARADIGDTAWEALRKLDRASAGSGSRGAFDWSAAKYAKARSLVGVLHVPGLVVEILPKIDDLTDAGSEEPTSAQRVLLTMLRRAGWLDLTAADQAPLGHERAPLLDAFIWSFARDLTAQLARGRDRAYVPIEENARYLRGRLVEPEHTRRNGLLRTHFYVARDELVEDTPIHRVLKGALRLLLPGVRSTRVRSTLIRLLEEFDNVGDARLDELRRTRIVFDRRNCRFESLIAFAKRVLGEESATLHAGEGTSYALLVPMEQLFEAFVAQLLRRRAHELDIDRDAVRPQAVGDQRFFLRHADTGSRTLSTKPDVWIRPHGEFPGAVLDTKWKLLDPDGGRRQGVRVGDVYQMAAYGQVYDVPALTLLHPRTPDVADAVWELPSRQRLYVVGIPLHEDPRRLEEACLSALRAPLAASALRGQSG